MHRQRKTSELGAPVATPHASAAARLLDMWHIVIVIVIVIFIFVTSTLPLVTSLFFFSKRRQPSKLAIGSLMFTPPRGFAVGLVKILVMLPRSNI